jgi:hypothetical protein
MDTEKGKTERRGYRYSHIDRIIGRLQPSEKRPEKSMVEACPAP